MKVLNEYVLIALFLFLLLLLLLFLMYIVKVRAPSSLPTPDSEKVTAAWTAMTLIEILNGLCEQNALYLFSLISCSFTNRSGLQFLSVRTSAVLLKQKLSYEFEKVSHNED